MSCDLNAKEAKKKDICYISRSSYTLYFEVTDKDNNPVDLSGKSLIFKVKEGINSSTSVAELTSTITVTGANNNIVGLPMDFDLKEKRYHHGLKNIDDDSQIMYGYFDVTESVND